ncbi:hypothetical protein BDI4_540003 [Burkholderia diffusa]|nr:hypothetical protein BDI4_540003 [Burkholderia diffusa]
MMRLARGLRLPSWIRLVASPRNRRRFIVPPWFLWFWVCKCTTLMLSMLQMSILLLLVRPL